MVILSLLASSVAMASRSFEWESSRKLSRSAQFLAFLSFARALMSGRCAGDCSSGAPFPARTRSPMRAQPYLNMSTHAES